MTDETNEVPLMPTRRSYAHPRTSRWVRSLVLGTVLALALPLARAQAAWETPTTLFTTQAPEWTLSSLALDVNGAGEAVASGWGEWSPGGDDVPSTQTLDAAVLSAGAWQPAQLFEGGLVDYADVAIDDAGNATATWLGGATRNTQGVMTSARAANGTWSAPQRISDESSGLSDYHPPRVAANARGDAVVAWICNGEDGTPVCVATRRAGGPWQPATKISDANVRNGWPRVAVDSEGRALVVWQGETQVGDREYEYSVQSRMTDVSGAWQPRQEIESDRPGDPYPAVTFDAADTAYVAWTRSESGSSPRVAKVAVHRSDDAAWSVPKTVSDPARDAWAVTVAAGGSGHVAVAWAHRVGSAAAIETATSNSGGATWSAPAILDQHTSERYSTSPPEAIVDRDGNALVVWTGGADTDSEDGGSSFVGSVHSSARPADGSWQATPTVVAAASATGAMVGNSIALDVDDAGAARILWAGIHNGVNTVETAIDRDFTTPGAPPAVDTTAPAITIRRPTDGERLSVGQHIDADFSCDDEPGGSGVATCDGSSVLDTSTPGQKTYTVTSTDRAGNASTKTVTYIVQQRPITGEDPPGSSEAPHGPDPLVTTTPTPVPVTTSTAPKTRPKPSARLTSTKIKRGESVTLTFKHVANSSKVTVTWKPKHGGASKQTVRVKKDKAAIKAPRKKGLYTVTVTYGKTTLAKRKIRVR